MIAAVVGGVGYALYHFVRVKKTIALHASAVYTSTLFEVSYPHYLEL